MQTCKKKKNMYAHIQMLTEIANIELNKCLCKQYLYIKSLFNFPSSDWHIGTVPACIGVPRTCFILDYYAAGL